MVKTDPAAGSELGRGKRVQVFVSTGPCNPACRATVPATKGKLEADARAVLGAAGFTVGQVVPGPSELPAGTVRETSPAELTEAPTNVAVVMFTSSGPASSSDSVLLAGPASSGAPSPARRGLPVPLPSNNPPPPIPTRPPPTPPPPPPPPPPPETCRRSLADQLTAPGLTITSPGPGDRVGAENESSGTAHLESNQRLWVLLCAADVQSFYVETEQPVPVSEGIWRQSFGLDTRWPGNYVLYAVVANDDWNPYQLAERDENGSAFVRQLPQNARYVRVNVNCCS